MQHELTDRSATALATDIIQATSAAELNQLIDVLTEFPTSRLILDVKGADWQFGPPPGAFACSDRIFLHAEPARMMLTLGNPTERSSRCAIMSPDSVVLLRARLLASPRCRRCG